MIFIQNFMITAVSSSAEEQRGSHLCLLNPIHTFHAHRCQSHSISGARICVTSTSLLLSLLPDHDWARRVCSDAVRERSLYFVQRCQRQDPSALCSSAGSRHVAERVTAGGACRGGLQPQGQPGLHAPALGFLQW